MKPALRTALGALLPDATETLVLRCCLASGEDCRGAWAEFQGCERPLAELFRTDRGELKRLGPLLLHNLRRNGVEVESRLLTVLRTGSFREELRSRIYLEVFDQVRSALGDAGIDPIVIRGAAFGETIYGDAALRHSHDIDLLVARTELARAAAVLAGAGFQPVRNAAFDSIVLTHRNSLPVRLHSSLYELSAHRRPHEELWARSRFETIGGGPARVLSPEDNLVQVLGHAAYSPSRGSLQWACDAWRIVAQRPGLDPRTVAAGLGAARLALAASILLGYLTQQGAPIPPALSEVLEAECAESGSLDRDLALYGLRHSAPGGLVASLRRIPGLASRMMVLAWTLFPSRAYLRWAHKVHHGAVTPAYYLIRALRAGGVTKRPADARA